ncbi:MAG: DUF159 family protein [Vicingaceae bacterium]|nr:MAG: DUF159 family protein [Vicingaceae bacterium]
MCFYTSQSKTALQLEQRFHAIFEDVQRYTPGLYVAFAYPETPVIRHHTPDKIEMLHWGLIPPWAKNTDIRKYTLNAKIETIEQKPSFKPVVKNRCLVLVDSFYEWKWLDPKGKQKQKYRIALPENEPFALGGLWSEWIDKQTGELWKTYTILTTDANDMMAEIHNSKKRMPIVLHPDYEQEWLKGGDPVMQDDRLVAFPE